MVRQRPEPDPSTWWERYGHRVDAARRRAGTGHIGGSVQETGSAAADGGGDPATDPTNGPTADTATAVHEDGDGAAAADGTAREELTGETILRIRRDEPTFGWRHVLLRATGGLINPGPGAEELRRRDVLHRIRRPLVQSHRVAVTSIKGGVGKTTVSTLLGLVMAEHRGDRVIALDANPDAGTLADRLTGESSVTVRELLRDLNRIDSWTEVSRYTSLAGRLQVLASEQDPAAGDAFNRQEYEQICALLDRFFNVIITDSGTGLVHSAMEGTLKLADSVIIVGAPTVDGAGRAAKTLDWMHAHGHGSLAADSVAVLSCDRTSVDVDMSRIREHFATRCRAVIEIPHDPHLATGGRVRLDRLRPRTRDAAYELAAVMADRFVP